MGSVKRRLREGLGSCGVVGAVAERAAGEGGVGGGSLWAVAGEASLADESEGAVRAASVSFPLGEFSGAFPLREAAAEGCLEAEKKASMPMVVGTRRE